MRELYSGSMTNTHTMLHGDCMSLMSTMPDGSYDAVITDPPYATGGTSSAARAQDPRVKYQSSTALKYYPTFANDCRDQRTHLMWSVRWMEQALRLTRPGGWLMVFSDWRQLPITSDALQIAGWTWRGIIPWDKTECCRPQLGTYRNQAEYVLTATRGGIDKSVRLCPPGVVREPIRARDKLHLTGKPVPVMEHLMTILPSGSRILDPFAGSGTTLVAARNKGHTAVGIELSSDYHRIATDRLGLVLPS